MPDYDNARRQYDNAQTYPPGYSLDGVSQYYDQQKESTRNPNLTIPRLRIGKLSDLQVSPDTFIHQGHSETLHRGLREYIRTTIPETEAPCYIFDQHNNAFFAWAEALKEGKITPGATLIHIDTHGDEDWGDFPPPPIEDLKQISQYTQDKLKIYNFIGAGLRSGIIGDVIWVTPFHDEQKIDDHPGSKSIIPHLRVGLNHPIIEAFTTNLAPSQIIVDFDVDYFQPFFDEVDALGRARQTVNVPETLAQDLKRIRELVRRAGVVTVATSPEFIDQQRAITLATQVLEK